MSNIVNCRNCGITISEKWFIFKQLVREKRKKNEKGEINNSDILAKLNIVRDCCKKEIITSLPDPGYLESLLE